MPPIEAVDGSFALTDSQARGIVGTARPGHTIEAINLSTAPHARLHLIDTVVIGRAGADGAFRGVLSDMREGDVIRVRTRGPDGQPGEWVTFKAGGISQGDTRLALVNLKRLVLKPGSNDIIEVTQNTKRPLSEPGAVLRFTNNRTGETREAVITDAAAIPNGFTLSGKAGDTFSVAASDGVNNTDFAVSAGSLTVHEGAGNGVAIDLVDPDIMEEDKGSSGKPLYKPVRYTGPVFVDGPSANDVQQGAIGDCYFPGAMASVAYHRPDAIKNMIKDNGDGTYTVRFFKGSTSGQNRAVRIDVDGDLYSRSSGGPIYGTSFGSTAVDELELWFPLVEKAYAKWKGSYESIGNGGMSSRVMSEVLGVTTRVTYLSWGNPDNVFEQIKDAQAKKRPMTASTHHDNKRYTNKRIYGDHVYSVLGVEEENGVRYVQLRNPWGESEPEGNGENDGFFRLEVTEFMELYRGLQIAQTRSG
ncbi:C2 family cysteine protease [Myxococcota bacterium]